MSSSLPLSFVGETGGTMISSETSILRYIRPRTPISRPRDLADGDTIASKWIVKNKVGRRSLLDMKNIQKKPSKGKRPTGGTKTKAVGSKKSVSEETSSNETCFDIADLEESVTKPMIDKYIQNTMAQKPWNVEIVQQLIRWGHFPKLAEVHTVMQSSPRAIPMVQCTFHDDDGKCVPNIWIPLGILRRKYPEETKNVRWDA